MRNTSRHVSQADGLRVKQDLTVTLTGRIAGLRVDADGLKVELAGDSFHVWFAAFSPGVELQRGEQS